MVRSAGDIVINIKADTSGVDSGMKSAEKSMLSFKNIAETALGFGVAQAGAKALNAIKTFTIESTKMAMEFQESFGYFSKLISGDADDFMRALQASAGMTISQIEAVSLANRALMMGISEEQMPKLITVSKILGDVMGTSTADAVNQLTMGLTAQSERMLRNIGIVIDTQKVYGDLGKEMDDDAKRSLLLNEVLGRSDEIIKNLGDSTETAKDKSEKLSAAWADMKLELGGLGSEMLIETGVLEGITNKIRDLIGSIQDLKTAKEEGDWKAFLRAISTEESVIGGLAAKTPREKNQEYLNKLMDEPMHVSEETKAYWKAVDENTKATDKNTNALTGEARGYYTGMTREEFLVDTQRGRTDVMGAGAAARYSAFRS